MKICVYGAASDKIAQKYIDSVYNLCKNLAKRGHSLVFGAGSEGVMGAAARGFKDGGGYVHGVIPKFFEENNYEAIFYEADKLTYTEDMAQRKATMENDCDAFIIAPGGIGTFEEFFQVLTLKQLGRHKKAIVLYNAFNYYDDMQRLLNDSIKQGFINKECNKIYTILKDDQEVIDYLEHYSTKGVDWSILKKNLKQ